MDGGRIRFQPPSSVGHRFRDALISRRTSTEPFRASPRPPTAPTSLRLPRSWLFHQGEEEILPTFEGTVQMRWRMCSRRYSACQR